MDGERPARVVVVGGPGSGKSTVARALAARLSATHLELDELWWGAGWTPVGVDALRERLGDLLDDGRWVVDGNYVDEVADLVWPRADLIVWLDVPRAPAVRRAVRRSIGRAARRVELWNGNRESLAVLSPPSIYRFVRHWPAYSTRIARALRECDVAEGALVRLRSDRDVAEWMRHV